MEKPARRSSVGGARLVALLMAAYALDAVLLTDWSLWIPYAFPWPFNGTVMQLIGGYHVILYASSAIAAVAMIVRALGKRFGIAALAARYPRLVRALPAIPGLYWVASYAARMFPFVHWDRPGWFLGHLLGTAIVGATMTLLARAALARATAPDTEARLQQEGVHPGETVFSAIAVTRVTRGAVVALGSASIAMAMLVALCPVSRLFHDPSLLALVVAYVTGALGTATLARKISRIVVGNDGVYVQGSGRARFTAWSALDEVRTERADIVLLRGGRVVLRLQLHGADAGRRDALAVRFRDAMDAAQRAKTEPAHVHAAHAANAGADRLASSVRGAVDYRQPAIQREQLWEVVEGSAADPSARTLAAEALAADLEPDERARLRVAAEHCAEPRVRIALERLLEDDDDELAPSPHAARLPPPG